MNVSLLGLTFADPQIRWPARNQPTPKLCTRKGWVRIVMPVIDDGKPSTIDAMHLVDTDLAVNCMIRDVGYATSLAQTGYRISFGGRVFATCKDAMMFCEELAKEDVNWTEIRNRGWFNEAVSVYKPMIEQAEQRGQILLDRVYPS